MRRFLLWDKTIHFVYMFAIQITLLLILGVWSLVASLVFPVCKETWDWKSYGKFDMVDLAAGLLGGVMAGMVWMV